MISQLERYKYALLAVVLAAGATFSYLFGSHAYNINKHFGFPLDDPWIHLQFAKNLHDYGSFSYFKNEMVTAGSTSPLYTLLLAVGFFFTSNEMMLSYVFGVLFLLVAAFYLFKLASNISDSLPLALGASLLLLAEPRMQWAALSGMETTLFIALLLGTLYFYQSKQSIAFVIASGFLIWARPEAIIMFIAIALDVVYHLFWVVPSKTKKKSEPPVRPSLLWLKKSAAIIAVFAVVYAVFNLYLSGSIFPNTFAAKIKYYSNMNRQLFATQVFHFLANGHMIVLAAFAGLGIISIMIKIWKRQSQSQLVPLLLSIGLFLAYMFKLPFLYQEGRYIMPVIPFVILLAVVGLQVALSPEKKLFGLVRKRQHVLLAQAAVVLFVITQWGIASWYKRPDYAEYCKYINDRQVRTGKWLHDHTPENAIIGTHDIGAIAFYSGRRIADMVGLVSPEMIDRIGSLDKLYEFLVNSKVTHIAALRNWFEIVNQNPIYKTNEREPEIMEVFAFDPQRTHLTSQDVSKATVVAGQYLYQGQFDLAGEALQRALSIDPKNSKVHHLIGSLFLATGRLSDAIREFNIAILLHPEFLEPQIGLAQVVVRQNKPSEAIAQLETIARQNPNYPTVYRALADVYATFKIDSAKSNSYMRRFSELLNAQQQ